MATNRLKLKPHDQQVMVITGATSGIGLALARAAAARGTAVFLIARNAQALEEVARELAEKGARAAYHAADVGVEAEVRAAASEALSVFGGWDVWVNDAGVSIFGPVRETPIEDHKRLFDTNYWGVVHGSLVALEHLRRRPGGGVLINVGSVLGDAPIPIQGAYGASKAAVKGFTEALRMELMREGAPVAVTLIKPGSVNTPHKDHAKNLTDGAVREPGPVYDARLVADAILYATRHRVREMTVGFAGQAMTVFHRMVPALAEPIFAKMLPSLQRDRRAPRRRTEDSLYDPGYDLAVGSDYGRVRRISAYTQLQKHPITALGAALAVGAGASLISLMLQRSRRRAAEEARAAPVRPSAKAWAAAAPVALAAAPLVQRATSAVSAIGPQASATLARARISGAKLVGDTMKSDTVKGARRMGERLMAGKLVVRGKGWRDKAWADRLRDVKLGGVKLGDVKLGSAKLGGVKLTRAKLISPAGPFSARLSAVRIRTAPAASPPVIGAALAALATAVAGGLIVRRLRLRRLNGRHPLPVRRAPPRAKGWIELGH